MSVGRAHSCAIRWTGEVICWGIPAHGGTRPPSGTYRSLSLGLYHSCAIRDSGHIDCWGSAPGGQVDAPAGKYRSVSTGEDRTCALSESGEVVCSGRAAGDRDPPPGPYRLLSLSVGSAEGTCAVRESGEAICWNPFENVPPDVLIRSLPVGCRGHARSLCAEGIGRAGLLDVRLHRRRGCPARSLSCGERQCVSLLCSAGVRRHRLLGSELGRAAGALPFAGRWRLACLRGERVGRPGLLG